MRSGFLVTILVVAAGCGRREEIPPDMIEQLRQGLKSPDASSRQAAAVSVGELGPKARALVPDLAVALEDKDDGVRIKAATAPDYAYAISVLCHRILQSVFDRAPIEWLKAGIQFCHNKRGFLFLEKIL